MARVFVSVGSNINRDRNIRSAIYALRSLFGNLVISSVYQSAAVGFDGEDFHNLVVGFKTTKSPQKVARVLKQIEFKHGRLRGEVRFAPRTLDLDLLLYDDLIIDQVELQLPREEITQYAFVLCPLAEVAGDMPHPRLGMPLKELWNEMKSNGCDLQTLDVSL